MSLKTRLIISFLEHPFRSRAVLVVAGVVAGIFQASFGNETSMQVSVTWLVIMGFLSSLVYAGMLTLYRLIQRLLKVRLKTKAGSLEYDERVLVSAAGWFWFIPYGATAYVLAWLTGLSSSYGLVVIVQGLALILGNGLSQKIME